MVNRLLNYRIIRSSIAENNQWIIFLHGIGGSSAIWFKQISTLRQSYNLLLIDLPGHGKNNLKLGELNELSFKCVANEVIKVMDNLNIQKADFIGFSIGTIIIQVIKRDYPDKIQSMILAGAVESLNIILKGGIIALGVCMCFLPHMFLYKIAAYIIAPGKSNKASRKVFIKEANKIEKSEFENWYKLMLKSLNIFKTFNKNRYISELYIMGERDKTFLPMTLKKQKNLKVIQKCGHVCNIENWKEFNNITLSFLNSNFEFRIVS